MPTRPPPFRLIVIAACLLWFAGAHAESATDTADADGSPPQASMLELAPVAPAPDPGPEPSDDVAGTASYDPESAMRRYDMLIEGGEFRAATDVAESMLARSQLRYGRDALQNLRPLEALAAAQLGNGAARDAETTLVQLIGLIESNEGIFHESLVEPLADLGDAHKGQGEFDDSLSAYIRARHITHRNYGVINGEQLPLIDQMTELHVAMGELREANREQRLAFRISETNCGDDALCRVDGIYKLAQWYQRLRRYTQARGLYKQALEILESTYGEDDTSLVPALHGVARTYEQQAQRFGEGRRSLERAAGILDAQPYVEVSEHVAAYVRLGDWHNLSNDHDQARAAYISAWEVLAAGDESAPEAVAAFGLPERLRYRPPTPDFGDPAWHESRLAGTYVLVEFDVNERGRVENAKVVDSTTSARIRKEVRDAVRRAKYRPKMQDGVPARADRVRLRQSFDYVSVYNRQRQMRDAANRKSINSCAGSGCATGTARAGIPIEVIDGPGSREKPDPLMPSDGAAVTEEIP